MKVVKEVCVQRVLLENIHRLKAPLLVLHVMGQESIKTKQDERVVKCVGMERNRTSKERIVHHVE
jgi:hypothetical protein